MKSIAPAVNCTLTIDVKRVDGTIPLVYEDFTDGTWNKYDPNNHIETFGPNHINFACHRDEDAYLYKDQGEGYFTDFEFLVTIRVNNLDLFDVGDICDLTNRVDDFVGLTDTNETFIMVGLYCYTAGPLIRLAEGYGSPYSVVFYSSPIEIGRTYYLRIAKTGTLFQCEIYGDADRTNLLDALSLTLRADHSFRYVFACNTHNKGTDTYCIGNIDIYNLVL